MTSSLQLLGFTTAASPPACYLFFDTTRYLLNIPEGTQRFLSFAHIKLMKCPHVMVTRVSPLTLGGLPGLCITAADLGMKQLHLYGPVGLDVFVQSMRIFSIRKSLEIIVHEFNAETTTTAATQLHPHSSHHHSVPVLKDSQVEIAAICTGRYRRRLLSRSLLKKKLTNTNTSSKNSRNARSPDRQNRHRERDAEECISQSTELNDSDDHPDSQPFVKRPRLLNSQTTAKQQFSSYSAHKPRLDNSSAAISPSTSSAPFTCSAHSPSSPSSFEPEHYDTESSIYSYIFTLASIPGKFDVARAAALGLKPGPLFALLKAGKSVSTPTGEGDEVRTIHPHECVNDPVLGPIAAVVDLPVAMNETDRMEILTDLVNNVAFNKYKYSNSTPISDESLSAINTASSSFRPIIGMMHFAAYDTVSHPVYIEFMKSFGPQTHHIIVHAKSNISKCLFPLALTHHQSLASLAPEAFSFHQFEQTQDDQSENHSTSPTNNDCREWESLAAVSAGQSLQRLHLLPISAAGKLEVATISSISGTASAYQMQAENLVPVSAGILQAKLIEIRESLNFSQQNVDARFLQLQRPKLLTTPFKFQNLEFMEAPPSPTFVNKSPFVNLIQQIHPTCVPELIFLGTGSAIPSKYRNVTGILLHPGHLSVDAANQLEHPLMGGIMLDCGEGTLGQAIRKWGFSTASLIMSSLSAILISHMHADHHLGLLSLLALFRKREIYARSKRLSLGVDAGAPLEANRKLLIIGPRRLLTWLQAYWPVIYEPGMSSNIVDGEIHFANNHLHSSIRTAVDDDLFEWITFISSDHLVYPQTDNPTNSTLSSVLLRQLSSNIPAIQYIKTVPVPHCADSYGFVIYAHQPLHYKLVYSGDCMPSSQLIDAGADCTILIHEATFEDQLVDEAREKHHSTISQAIWSGAMMRAEHIILTHFSQRYPKAPSFIANPDLCPQIVSEDGDGDGVDSNTYADAVHRVILAFDLMRVRFDHLHSLPRLNSAYEWMFTEESEEDSEPLEL